MLTHLEAVRQKLATQIPRDEGYLETLLDCLVLAGQLAKPAFENDPPQSALIAVEQAVRLEFAEQMDADSATCLAVMANARNLDDIVDFDDLDFAADIIAEALNRIWEPV